MIELMEREAVFLEAPLGKPVLWVSSSEQLVFLVLRVVRKQELHPL